MKEVFRIHRSRIDKQHNGQR